VKVAIVAVIMAGIASVTTYYTGYRHAASKHLAQFHERESELRQALAQAQGTLREKEREHTRRVSELRDNYEQEARAQSEANAALIADLNSQRQRVRVKVTDCTPHPVPDTGAAPESADGAGTAELDPATAARIWAIAADGERAIRKLNALQQWALEAVELCQ
jgi:hypothetical protein